jgi:flagellar basal body-associated protein FliL
MGGNPTTEPSDLQAMESALTADEGGGASPAPAPAPEAPKKKKKRKEVAEEAPAQAPWMDRFESSVNSFLLVLRDTLGGLFSSDPATRRMSLLFLLSLAGICLVGVVAWKRHEARMRMLPRRESGIEQTAKQLGQFASRIAEDVKRRHVVTALGEFTVELKRPPLSVDVAPGVINMAEVQLVVECDTRETCTYIEKAIDQARHQVTSVFVPIDREELMSREGKRRLKKRLIERLNLWLPRGKIDNIYFTRLIIS